MDTWTLVWLFWLGLFLIFELTAVLLHKPTLSQKTWDWFSLRARKRWWLARRVVFATFWLSLGIGHFLLGGPALWTVILPGIPFAAVIIYAVFFERRDEVPAVVVKQGVNPMKQRLIASLLFGAGAVIAAMQASGIPSNKQGWLGLAGVFVMTAYGKFSAADSLIGVNRKVWTDEERSAAAVK